ncbi:hypothetical protein GCM10011366_18240 [Ornithinimicrobium tianjinense]|uniref:Uncharacterized protein n=1 Tax=Ornithinimicrobium tianjinense TaxID=1195761 RepID=A0A917BLE0_9MICO|nr:hypothetical protein GCM10011366_18240 [Ornithinimicrobium tianjinense]
MRHLVQPRDTARTRDRGRVHGIPLERQQQRQEETAEQELAGAQPSTASLRARAACSTARATALVASALKTLGMM